MKYTIAFNFPGSVVYPMIGGGFETTITKNTRFWATSDIAVRFAEEMCGKYSYEIVEVKA